MSISLSLQCLTLITKTKGSFETSVCTVRHDAILWRKSRQQHPSDDIVFQIYSAVSNSQLIITCPNFTHVHVQSYNYCKW